jgi:two-component system, NarL family, sensor histidine kinase BarA
VRDWGKRGRGWAHAWVEALLQRVRAASRWSEILALRTTDEALTALKRENRALRAALDEALTASRTKSELLANVAHEIRTPMNGVHGFANLLLHTRLDEAQRDYACTIQKSSHALLGIVDDLLDFARLEAGRLVIQCIPFDLNECLEDAITLLAPTAHDKGLELVLIVYSDVPLRLRGDPVRLRQVLINLIGNAIKFTEAGEVVVRAMREDTQDDRVVVRVSVTDTGSGVSPRDRARLFRPFAQAEDAPAVCRPEGSGLGLAISKQLVEHMGGRIGLEAMSGRGSSFWFTAHLGLQSASPGAAASKPLDRVRALVYDAHPLARLAIRHRLIGCGIAVSEVAERTRIADELARVRNDGRSYDIVVLGLSRQEATTEQFQPLAETVSAVHGGPTLALINSVKRADRKNICKLGAAACLPKPVRHAALYRTLLRLLAPGPARHPASVRATFCSRAAEPLKLRVLIVDDDPVNRKLVTAALQGAGSTVVEATDGAEAVRLSAAERFDIIFMDMHMPGMSGIEATAALRATEHRMHRTPVVALTADAGTARGKGYIAAGLDDCLLKPVDAQSLWSAVQKWVVQAPEASTRHAEGRFGHGAGDAGDGLLDILLAELPATHAQLADALACRDLQRLEEAAHRLHGATCYTDLPALRAAAAALELAASHGDWDALVSAFEETEVRLEEVLALHSVSE